MKKIFVAGLAAAIVVGVPAVSLAAAGALRASGGFSGSLDLQASKFTTTSSSTSSMTSRRIGRLSGLNICAIGQVSATLSVELNGAPASFQIRVDGGPLMQPQAVRFVPAGPHDSFSFTFVNPVGTFEANDHHSFDVEWRSPSGRTTTLERGTLNLLYQHGTQSC